MLIFKVIQFKNYNKSKSLNLFYLTGSRKLAFFEIYLKLSVLSAKSVNKKTPKKSGDKF